MNYTDAHAHLDDITWENLEQMSLCGIRRIIAPVHLAAGKAVSCETIREVWDYLFDVQFGRAKNSGIEPYAMIGISMVSTPREDPAPLYAVLPEYLKRPEVVAIGEIGIEPASKTCTDLKQQEAFVRDQVALAKQADICVDFHTPFPPEAKREYTQMMLDISREIGLPMSKVIIDHCTDANLGLALDAGASAAISVQPWRGVTGETAADLIMAHGFERIMVDSDCSGLPSDPLAVPKTARALRKKGASEAHIADVCGMNSQRIYGL